MTVEAVKVLVVDDDSNLTDLLVDTLDAIGYHALPANSGEQALKIINDQHPSLVISDINMPGMSGIELLYQIREINQQLPVMLITGVNSDSIQKQVQECGADGFLAKPFRISRIEQEINNLLQGSSRRRVLVVDDNEEFLESMRDRLETAENIVYSATSSAEAWRILEEYKIDLVITDLKLPDGDGLSLFGKINESFPKLPVIVISAYATDEIVKQAKDSGIAGFIPKPFNYTQLESALSACAIGIN